MTVTIIVVLYLMAMLGVGYYAMTKVKNNTDFMVAGRRLGPLLVAGSLAATQIGGGSSLGVAEMAYGDWGLGAAWYVLAMAVTFFITAFIGPKLRGAMVKTVPEYFRRRYGEAPGIVTAITMLLPLIGLTAIQIIASSVVLSVMSGLAYAPSVIIVACVMTLYAIMGGLWAVTLTDVIQMFMIIIGMALAIPYSLAAAGGWGEVVRHVPATQLNFTQGISWPTIIGLIIMYTASFAVGQESVNRYYAAKDDKSAFWGSMGAAAFSAVFAFIPAVLGIIALALVNKQVLDATDILQHGTRYILPTLALQTMPPVIVGLLFAGLISATMSSADSNLLGAGSIFSNDIYKVYLNRHATENQIMKITRIGMLIIAILSTIMALMGTGPIIPVLMFAFTLRAGGAFIPYVVGHYWKKASAAGAMASIIVGSTAVVLVERGIVPFWGLSAIYPGILSSLIVFLIFTNLSPNHRDTTDLLAEEIIKDN